MINIHKTVDKKLWIAFALSVALMWTCGTLVTAEEGNKSAGHDQCAHAEDEADDKHEEHDHEGGDHAEDEHGEREEDEHDDHAENEGDENDEYGDHDGRESHADEDERVVLTPEQRERFGIVVRAAGPGDLYNEVSLPGEIVFNEDRVVHLVPRVAGIVREVAKTVGDTVTAGEVLAVIDSRELADAKAGYLADEARVVLAEKTFAREKALHEKLVSSEQDFLEAEQALTEARIELRSSEQKLHALGIPEEAVEALGDEHDETITRYEILSPIDGVVTEKHIALGESLDADADIMTVVDTSGVWVNLAVYTKDLAAVHNGQEISLRVDHSGAQARGKVAMITSFVEESTRSATARVVLDNSDGRWMPGTFVTGFISTSEDSLSVVVPRDAVQNIEGRDVVFVQHEGSFEMTPVTLGRADRTRVEITTGLAPGTSYVSEGAFKLKATVITSNLGSHAGHGH